MKITVKWQEVKDEAREKLSVEQVDKYFAPEIEYVQGILDSPEFTTAVTYANGVRTAEVKRLKDELVELIKIENELETLFGEMKTLYETAGYC